MAAQQSTGPPGVIPPAVQNISLFPPPPIYAENYTTENIKKGLVQPPPPVPTKFDVFGEPYDLEGPLLPSLTELGCQQLYSASGNWRSELLKLNRSLVAAFLDLIEILIKCPDNDERLEKIETIRALFINIHHLINEYRPVQARDTLRQIIKHQNLEITRVTEKLNKYVDLGTAALESLNIALRNFVLDETIPKPSSFFDEFTEERMETEDQQQQHPSTSETANVYAESIKPIELPARLSRREIPEAKQILNKFAFYRG